MSFRTLIPIFAIFATVVSCSDKNIFFDPIVNFESVNDTVLLDMDLEDVVLNGIELPSVRKSAVAKWGFVVANNGDTIYKVIMNNIIVYPPERFKSKEDEEYYWRTVRDVLMPARTPMR